MARMIVADENIPHVAEAFAGLGEVTALSGRAMTPAALADAEILLVRSITKVNEALLGGSAVRFVGTATIGVDHVDEAFLGEAGIGFASAPGSNANSVAEYVTAAMLTWAERRRVDLAGKTIGIVGVGHVGGRVVKKAQALGMRVLCCDPPRQRVEGLDDFVSLDDLLAARPDVLTFHVPLTHHGDDATFHMIGRALLEKTEDFAPLLINSSRGAVQDTPALLDRTDGRKRIDLAIDTWEDEPNIDATLLERAALGTPHIAGYSYDGKVAGVRMLHEAASRFLGVEPTWSGPADMPAPRHPVIEIEPGDASEQAIVREAVRHAYDIEWDDASLRQMLEKPAEERGAYFDSLRRNYWTRREFAAAKVRVAGEHPQAEQVLRGIGFELAD